jgi:hypothetical protein
LAVGAWREAPPEGLNADSAKGRQGKMRMRKPACGGQTVAESFKPRIGPAAWSPRGPGELFSPIGPPGDVSLRNFGVSSSDGNSWATTAPDLKAWTGKMHTVYDFVTIICFICMVITYFMFTDGGMRTLAHFLLSGAAFAIANQVGNHAGNDVPMNALAIILIVAGIAYTYINVRH